MTGECYISSSSRGHPAVHWLRPAVMGVITTLAVLALGIADAGAARGGGGGAGRAGGGGYGGRMAQSSVAGANRSMAQPGARNIDAANVNRGNVNAGNVNTGNLNRNNVNTGNVNRNNVNTGNINVGNDVNVNIDGGYGYHGNVRYPVAAGVVIGAMAVTTAAVLGSYYSALPPGCTVVIRTGVSYHYCGSVYYQQRWSGDDVVYVVVNP